MPKPGVGWRWLLLPSICTVFLSKLHDQQNKKTMKCPNSKTLGLCDSDPQHGSTYLDTQCGWHGAERWALLDQVKNETGHLFVSGAMGPSALMLHLPAATLLYVSHRPGPLTKASPPGTLVKHSPSKDSKRAYCALRSHHGMGRARKNMLADVALSA